ncbi:MAG: hypothetical protein JWN04_3637, partial [Myxococcaceae bacterium]|nr:hypothetical protein [Myxococcaceae bacterium]
MTWEFAARLRRLVWTGRFALALITLSSAFLWLLGAPFLTPMSLPTGPAVAVLLAGFAPAVVKAALCAADANKHVRALFMLLVLGASA